MKTIEERALALVLEMRNNNSKPMAPMIEKVMRDLIEDAAKRLDNWAKINTEACRTYEAAIITEAARVIWTIAKPAKDLRRNNQCPSI